MQPVPASIPPPQALTPAPSRPSAQRLNADMDDYWKAKPTGEEAAAAPAEAAAPDEEAAPAE